MNGHTFEPSPEVLEPAVGAHVPCRTGSVARDAPTARDHGLGAACGAAFAAALLLVLTAAPARAEETPPSPDEDTVVESGGARPDAQEAAAPAGAVDDAAAAEDAAEDTAAKPLAAADAEGDEPPAPSALGSAIDDVLARVHGSVSLQYRGRRGSDDTDQDLYQWLDLRIGDENADRISATVFLRATADLDRQRDRRDAYEFTSLADSYDSSANARLYSGYLTWRPGSGPAALARIGRQYVYSAETFHLDGVYAESRELHEATHMTAAVYGGVPVHLYERSPSGDWITGAALSAEPFRWTRATVDYVHVSDDYDGAVRDDLAALRVWQRANPWLDLYGRVSYLDALRDVELRATARFDEQDLLVQATWYRLLEPMDEEFTTEFDPYFTVLHTLHEYDQARLRAVKGFGEELVLEVGADVRDVRDTGDEGASTRDTRRWYVMPTFPELLWEGAELSLIAERWSGNGQRLQTYGGEVTHRVSDDVLVSLGTDYSLYGYDAFRDRERNHVRTVFADLRWKLSDRLTLRVRHSHEKDDEETYDVFTLGLTLAF